MHIAPLPWCSEVAGYHYDWHVACSELHRAHCIAQILRQCHGPTLLLALFDVRALKFASSASVSISSASTKSRREFQPRQAAWMVVLLCSLASSFCSGLMLESGFGDAGTRRSGCGQGTLVEHTAGSVQVHRLQALFAGHRQNLLKLQTVDLLAFACPRRADVKCCVG